MTNTNDMPKKKKYVPQFYDRVLHARKDGTVLNFDDAEVLIEYDDGVQDWVRIQYVRLQHRGLPSYGKYFKGGEKDVRRMASVHEGNAIGEEEGEGNIEDPIIEWHYTEKGTQSEKGSTTQKGTKSGDAAKSKSAAKEEAKSESQKAIDEIEDDFQMRFDF